MPKGRGAASLTLQTGLSKGQEGEPLSVASDLWYGVTDRLQVGVVSSVQGLYGLWSGAIAGFSASGACLSGPPEETGDAGCNGLFESAGIEAVTGVARPIVAHIGLHLVENDPRTVRLKTALAENRCVVSFGTGPIS